ncbi:hypothetical protein V495_05720 [Pseudogymnoascus sp. VKM F-4514 (FW-929)]|nr:hypothetical protein V495_05720 [Pseudogymnoascus sp. VKM F-4514 (FW-929)]KFY59358.1 hypothetical protein V497_04361 [Pseudogymnoascus sp. VKM F-4516 (FW-969)]
MSLLCLDIKPDEPGSTGTSLWNGYRVPLPAPMSRFSHHYEQSAPVSEPQEILYSSSAKDSYSPSTQHQQPQQQAQNEMQPRRGSESLAVFGGTKLNSGLSSHRSYPSLKRPYESLEEHPYGNVASSLHESIPEFDDSTKPTIQSDNRLLSFEPLPQGHTVLDQYGGSAKLEVVAQIHGMFFLSEIATHAGDNIIMQPELTCYRRNLFQVSGSVTCPSGQLSVVTDHGESMPIVSHEIEISATESVDGNVIRLIVIPWKTPPAISPDLPSGQEQEPAAIPIDIVGNQDKNNEIASQQIAWRRLQFRVATANNGRRKELQQHFVLRLKLISTLADGSRVCTTESSTAPIVVRGRSPRNFQARKEIPLVGSSASPRGHNSRVSPSQKKESSISDRPGIAKPTMMDLPKRPFQFDGGNFPPSPLIIRGGYPQWNQAQQHSGHVASAATQFPQPSNTMPVYHNEAHRIHAAQDPNPPPHHGLPEQTPPIEPSSRHFYSPPTSSPAQFDPNPRPMKSPRHTEVPHNSVYQPFEASYANNLAGNNTNRLYYPHAPAPPPWSSTETDGSSYGTALHLPPQQPPHQTEHQRQPSQDYNFASEAYIDARDDAQNIGYTWSAPS